MAKRSRRVRRFLGVCVVASAAVAGAAAHAGDVSPPLQPTSGPGGSDYAHAAVSVEHWGEKGDECWVFAPDSPRPAEAPVVVFLHGWGGTSPSVYGAWIRHLVRKGNLVVFPRYQETVLAIPRECEGHAFAAVKAALAKIAEGKIRARPEGIVAIGHSMGGVLAANLAAVTSETGLPPTRALLCVEPGSKMARMPAVLARYRYDFDHGTRVAADLLAVCVAGDQDNVVGEAGARAIYDALAKLPRENRDLLLVPSDEATGLVATHFAPCAFDAKIVGAQDDEGRGKATGTKALDFYGWWKLADALVDAVFRGKNKDYALGGGEHQLFMGTRSDGSAAPRMRRLGEKEWR